MAKSPKKPAARKPAKKTPVGETLSKVIVNALPTSALMMKHFNAAFALLPQLEKEMKRAEKAGAIQLARAFVAMHRMDKRLDEMAKPLTGKSGLFELYKSEKIPALFEQFGVPHVSLDEGYRVGTSAKFYASINRVDGDAQASLDVKRRAFEWLQQQGLGDVIQPVVNASSLSSAVKELMETKNVEPPTDLFTVAMVPNTSVTKT